MDLPCPINFQGGQVIFDCFKYSELNEPIKYQNFHQDMLYVKYDCIEIDISFIENTFIIFVIKAPGDIISWENPLEEFIVQDPKDIVNKIQSTIDFWVPKMRKLMLFW